MTLAGLPFTALAQEDRPQITPGERKAPRKKDAGPRALAVLEMSDKGKTSLIPIAILIDGKFWDASSYRANPVPMALDSGTVYEAERTGSSAGLFTVSAALHSNYVLAKNPWIATGAFVPEGTEKPKPALQATSAPVGIDVGDGPPRLTRNNTKSDAPASAPAAPGNKTVPPPSGSSPSGSSPSSGDDPPRLTKSTPPPEPPAPSPAPTAPSSGDDSKSAAAKAEPPANVATSDSGANEGNRPRLRRGKPVETFADEEVAGYSKPGAKSSAKAGAKTASEAAAVVDIIPAISDAAGPPPHSYKFEWLKDEEGERRQQITALAKEQVRAYIEGRTKAATLPASSAKAVPAAAKRALAKKLPDPILENVKMIAYDLWNTSQPVMIFSADAHMPPPSAGTPHSEGDAQLQYSIVLVAYPDIYNNLHKMHSIITDKYHLDMTPRLDLVDAVDADGDGRGELLFRQTSDVSTGWIVYRATADKLWPLYDSLASQ